MKYRFIDSTFDADTLISTATIEHGNCQYTGQTKVAKEDMDKISKYTGCRFAEMKAEILMLKDELRKAKFNYKICQDFIKSVSCLKSFDKESQSAKAAYHQLNKRKQAVEMLEIELETKRNDFLIAIQQRDIVTRAIQRKKDKEAQVKNS